jgi:hypothetical protein
MSSREGTPSQEAFEHVDAIARYAQEVEAQEAESSLELAVAPNSVETADTGD